MRLAQDILQYQHVYVFGIGFSAQIAEQLRIRLARSGKIILTVGAPELDMPLTSRRDDSLAIMISQRGRFMKLHYRSEDILKYFRKYCAKTWLVTQLPRHEGGRFDETIHVLSNSDFNVSQAVHCMTRLRLTLKDGQKADLNALKSVSGVAGAQFSGGQLQVIIGTNVGKVYDEFLSLTGLSRGASIKENLDTPTQKKSAGDVVNSLFSFISGTMSPVIPALIASGLIKTVVAIFGPQLLGIISEDSNIYTYLTFLGDAGMYFLPVFLAVSACNKLKANWAIGVYLAVAMLHPTFVGIAAAGADFTILGIPCSVQNYSSSFMPIMLSVWVMSYVERFIKKHTPDALQVLLVPFGTVMVMTPIALCVLGPIGAIFSDYMCGGITALYDIAGPLATMLIGGLFLLLVFTGMHPAFYVYLFATFPVLGYDAFFLPGTLGASWPIAGAFLACMFKFKKKENRSLTISSFIAWIAGDVGEPFMFGILLRQKKLLLACMIGGAIGGLTAGLSS